MKGKKWMVFCSVVCFLDPSLQFWPGSGCLPVQRSKRSASVPAGAAELMRLFNGVGGEQGRGAASETTVGEALHFDEKNDWGERLTITFVTGNRKKLSEAQSIFDSECDIPFRLEPLGGLDLDELQSDVPEKIAAAKCRLAARVVGGPVMVDDTSLCFTALEGMPGPYIKWFMNTGGCEGLVRMLHGFSDRRAWAQCCIAFSPGPGAEPCVYTGKTHGRIMCDVAGDGGFGWDAIFVPDWLPSGPSSAPYAEHPPIQALEGSGAFSADGSEAGTRDCLQPNNHLNLTFAQVGTDVKNKISHRSRALRQLAVFLQENEEWVYGRAMKRKNRPNPPSDLFSFRRRRKML